MKRIICIILCCICVCFGFSGCGSNFSNSKISQNTEGKMGTYNVISPDGNLTVKIEKYLDGRMYYTVNKNGIAVVETSNLGLEIEEDDFNLTTVTNISSKRITGSYENISGKSKVVSYDCNQLTISLSAWYFDIDLVLRAYNDGYAFRYNVTAKDGSTGYMTLLNEKTEFNLPNDANLWAQQYESNRPAVGEFFSYETEYFRRSLSSLEYQYFSMPLLYKVRKTEMYSLITESELIGSGYYGSFLQIQEGNLGTGRFKTVHTPAGCTPEDNQIAYPFSSPWRIGITGSLSEVVESELVEQVYDDATYWKPDNYDQLTTEEQEIYNYDWVTPGGASWYYLQTGAYNNMSNLSYQYEYVDRAHDMGWQYTILDAGWKNASDENILALTSYAKSKDVKIIVWCNALPDFGNGNTQLLVNTLDYYQRMGISGIKIDFFDGQSASNAKHQGEDIGTIKWYETIYQECAKRQMVVVCHGCNKPTGERRVYPNVLSREAICGNEFSSVSGASIVLSMFTRGVVGATDFTPVVYPQGLGTTMAHQMALAVLYESGIQTMADAASVYEDVLIKDFYTNIPSLRDKTVFVAGNPDDYCVMAIKSGDVWYVAGINGLIESEVSFDFGFLGSGSYRADYYVNHATTSKEIVTSTKTITSTSTESIQMVENGGFVIKLTKN